MVVTNTDLKNLPPKERLEALRVLEAKRKQELEALQQEKEQELRKTHEELEDAIDELSLEDERHVEDEERKKKAASLDEAVAGEEAGREHVPNVTYESPLEGLVPRSLYELSDYNLYGELRRIEQKGYMTPEEQRRVAQIRGQAEAITEAYSPADVHRHDEASANYISRTADVLRRLDQRLHSVGSDAYDSSRRQDVFDGSGYKRA
jgi:hypothetical protein